MRKQACHTKKDHRLAATMPRRPGGRTRATGDGFPDGKGLGFKACFAGERRFLSIALSPGVCYGAVGLLAATVLKCGPAEISRWLQTILQH